MDELKKEKSGNPWDNANPLSKLLFTWTIPFFVNGFRSNVNFQEVYKVPKDYRSATLAEDAIRNWANERTKSTTHKSKSLLWVLMVARWKEFIILFIFMVIDECSLKIIPVLFLGRFVNSFTVSSTERKDQFILAAIICFVPFVHNLLTYTLVWSFQRIGFATRIALSSLIFRKMLRLPQSAKEQAKIGHIVNLLSNDAGRFDSNIYLCLHVFTAPMQFFVLLYFLWSKIGTASFVGIVFILMLSPAQYFNGILSKRFRKHIAQYTDERGKIVNEIIGAIRAIKMYAWEKPFSDLVTKIRSSEIIALRKQAYLRGLILYVYSISSKLIPYMTIVVTVLLGNEISAAKVFFALAMYNLISDNLLFQFATSIAWIGELLAAIKRMEDFLLLEEQQFIGYDNKWRTTEESCIPKIALKNLTTRWTNDEIFLDGININVQGNILIMIAGAVGSGKTTLLNVLISELEVSQGRCQINGRLSYCSQEPWIFTGSIRQNILFGTDYNDKRYKDVIKACALIKDFQQLPHGDLSPVGERGITLSGGQKARINLARSLYREADIYILDDPLSAVDSHVSRHIFGNCIRERLRGKLTILVTHQLQYLPFADHVIVLKKGTVLAQGKYTELVELGIEVANVISDGNGENGNTEENTKQSSGNIDSIKQITNSRIKDEGERMNKGSVTKGTYWSYFRLGGNMIQLTLLAFLIILSQVLQRSVDCWLSLWATTVDSRLQIRDMHVPRDTTVLPQNMTEQTFQEGMYSDNYLYLYTYTGLVVAFALCAAIKVYLYFSYSLKISLNLYNKMFAALMRTPLQFFDKTPSGRIMNRFTKDVGTFDEMLPQAFYNSIDCFSQFIGIMFIVIYSNYYLLIPAACILLILWTMRTFYVETSRKVKRLESVARSPIFTHLSASSQGISTIRAFGHQERVIKEFDDLQDIHSSVGFVAISTSRAFASWIDHICVIFLSLVTYSFLTVDKDSSSGNVGLVLTSIISLLSNLQWGTRQSAETENLMVCVERAMEYIHLDSEAPLESKNDRNIPKNWPKEGKIEFDNVSLSYDGKNDVLKNVSFDLHSAEKLGIVGRTGAGKTSVISALFRLKEPRGDIYIDGILINKIGLHTLRSKISIIPQDPVLFSGTIRYNLDPFDQFEDMDLVKAIEEVQLKDSIPSLELQVTDGGSNFSVGERQLLCLARVMLRKNKIIIMDEATSSVDSRTDDFIQSTIRQKFSDCSIITIAHRLNTVADSDRILVLEDGKVKEFDPPQILLQNPEGVYSSLVQRLV